jgi:hypothetical protein
MIIWKLSGLLLTADGLEETVAVCDEVVELLDVAPGTRGLAMAFVVDAKHTEPRRGQLDPTCCMEIILFPTIR